MLAIVENCREVNYQALSTCNSARIYIVLQFGPHMQNLDKRKGKKVMQKNTQIPKTSGITLEFMFSGLLKGP